MKVATGNALNAMFVSISFAVVLLRFACRIFYDRRTPIIADYVALAGWLCALGWIIMMALAYHITPNNIPNSHHTSVEWLKISYGSLFFFDVGLILPKISITMFYWWLIPPSSNLRKSLWVCTVYVTLAFIGTFLSDLLFCQPISDNWSIENQSKSVWSSATNITVNWSLNISTDAILFLMPIVIIREIRLAKPQKLTLLGVCSLGLITMTVSSLRYGLPTTNIPHVFPPEAALWYTAEMCTGTIVVCLPSLKPLMAAIVERMGVTFGQTKISGTGVRSNTFFRTGQSSIRLEPKNAPGIGTGARSPSHEQSRVSGDNQWQNFAPKTVHHADAAPCEKLEPDTEKSVADGTVMVVTEVTLSSERPDDAESQQVVSQSTSLDNFKQP